MANIYIQKEFLEDYLDLNLIDKEDEFITKYLFVKKLLKKKIHVNDGNIIEEYNSSKVKIGGFNNAPVSISSLCQFLIRERKNVLDPILSDEGLIMKIRQLATNIDNVPDYLLIKADKSFCERVMRTYGIVCIGLFQRKIEIDAAYCDVKIEKCMSGVFAWFCNSLQNSSFYFNKAALIDRYLFHTKVDYKLFSNSIKSRYQEKITIYFCENPRNINSSKTRNEVLKELKSKGAELPKNIEVEIISNDFHDRYFISNSKIYTLGNGISSTNETHITSYPFALYFEEMPEKVRRLYRN